MSKAFFRAAALIAFLAGFGAMAQPDAAQAQSPDSLVQPFSGPQLSPGQSLPNQPGQPPALPDGIAPDPAHLVPPAPAAILRPLTLARPVVVELFTAEGCATCPTADQNLAALAQRRDLLALSYHVDYWDYTGWRDRFARPDHAVRHRAYTQAMGDNMVYTPQILVAGALPVLGSDRVAIETALREARNRKVMAEPVLTKDGAGDIALHLPAMPLKVPATLWLVTFSHRVESDVTAGENEGRRLVSINTVRSIRKLGQWHGQRLVQSIRLTDQERAAAPDGCAIIANEVEFGPVVAAGAWHVADLQ
ncbi:hypothetical protein A8950_0205 [Dongia mobilis]|uniref:DUF1223 domain-containing protein n=1 Tax=Dongia mobilis TaxID=578943 RepID=A0A4R6WX36_9PROT|nr:DUF1223 domain-containing protein [Dongia mobilis]TDQ85420.1 hypothetical protein A8950_0205 [Dongia mobilis]